MNKKGKDTTYKTTGYIRRCQICFGDTLQKVLALGHHPPVHAHRTESSLHESEVTYPLNLCRCGHCGLLQLDYIPDPAVVFPPEYPYKTGVTNMLVRNFRSLAENIINEHKLSANDLVVDIGSNDGTLLFGFKERGIRVLGVEPTNVAQFAQTNGIPTIQKYFTASTARAIAQKHGKAKIITATNVFAHVNNLEEFMEGIQHLLLPDGVFVSDSQYLMDIIKKLEFDTIYHEHLRFYSLKPLLTLFSKKGFSMIDAERISAAGGSIRVYAMKGEHPQSPRVSQLVALEEKEGLYDKKTIELFAERSRRAKRDLLALLLSCKKNGDRIVGVGAPARSNTLLNFVNIDADIVDYAGERRGSPKIGLYAPGSHIPIYDEEKIITDKPEYALILSWHIGDELMKKLRSNGYRGKFIMPLPIPRIVDDI